MRALRGAKQRGRTEQRGWGFMQGETTRPPEEVRDRCLRMRDERAESKQGAESNQTWDERASVGRERGDRLEGWRRLEKQRVVAEGNV